MDKPDNSTSEKDKLELFDYLLLALIACVYPFIAWGLIRKADIIAYVLPISIFFVASYITYAALKDFKEYYDEVTGKRKRA